MRARAICMGVVIAAGMGALCGRAPANIVFDFNGVPAGSALPDTFATSLLAGGVHAIISSSPFPTAYSITDPTTTLGKLPAGFTGNAITPNRTDGASDLEFMFDKVLTSFSIQIATNETNLTSSATIRVTDVLFTTQHNVYNYSNTPGGTWPSGTFSFFDPAGFSQVAIRYQADPPTGTPGTFVRQFAVDNLVVDVPEPATLGVLGVSSALLLLRRRGRRAANGG